MFGLLSVGNRLFRYGGESFWRVSGHVFRVVECCGISRCYLVA